MYSSDLSLESALRHHRQGVEVPVECAALWVQVWVGCRCTGHLFPTLKKTKKNRKTNSTDGRASTWVWTWEWRAVSALRCPPCLTILLGPLGCWGGGGGGGGGDPWSCPCERSAVPYTATVRVVYQPRSTKPSVFTCIKNRISLFSSRQKMEGGGANLCV